MNFKGINLLLLPLIQKTLPFLIFSGGIEATDHLNSLELFMKCGDDISIVLGLKIKAIFFAIWVAHLRVHSHLSLTRENYF